MQLHVLVLRELAAGGRNMGHADLPGAGNHLQQMVKAVAHVFTRHQEELAEALAVGGLDHVQRILRRDAEARNQRIGCAHAAVQALVLADVGIAQHRDAVQAVVVVRAVQLLGFLHDGLFEFRIRHPQNAEYVFLCFNLHDRFLLVSFSAESRPSGGPPLPHA